MPNKQYLLPVSNTPGSGGGGGTGTVTSVTFTGDGAILSATPSSAVTTTGTLTATAATQSGNKVIASPANGSSGVLTARTLVAADIPSGTVTWDKIGSAVGNLTLSNAGFTTTINQTSAVTETIANTTPTVTGAATTVGISTGTPPSNVSGNTWRYTLAASESGAGSNAWAGASITISGYTGGATGNNGTGLPITASTTTTIDVTNATGTTTSAGTPVAISTAVSSSPILALAGTINSGTAGTLNSIADTWNIQAVPGSVVPNPTSTLALTHSGSTGNAAVQVPAGAIGTASAWGLTFAGTTVGLAASAANTVAILGSTPSLRFYNGATLNGEVGSQAASSIAALGSHLQSTPANSSVIVAGNIGTTINVVDVLIGGQTAHTGTSAVQTGVSIGNGTTAGAGFLSFSPTSGSANFVALQVAPVINQTSSASGSYTGLLVNVVETALLGSSNKLLDLQAGTTGGTSKFSVSNSGVCTSAGNAGITQAAEAVGTLATTGGIVTTFTAVSDERTKIAEPYDGGLDEILSITPIRYRWNEIGSKLSGQSQDRDFIGFSAQDVQKQIPEAVFPSQQHEYLCFEDRPVIAALVGAVKQLAARVAELESR